MKVPIWTLFVEGKTISNYLNDLNCYLTNIFICDYEKVWNYALVPLLQTWNLAYSGIPYNYDYVKLWSNFPK